MNREQNASQHIEYAQDRIRQTCLDRDPTTFLECVTVEVIAAQDHGRAESDLDAQQAMALWAKLMTLASLAALAVTSIGVYLVWGSLRAAQEAVDVTRDIGKTQTRVYVDAAKTHFFWGGKGKTAPRVEMWVRAFGNTPAKWHEVRIHHFVVPRGEGPLDIPWSELSDANKIGKWSVLVAGDDRKLTLNLTGHRESIAKCLIRRFELPTHEFYVFGDITYCTFFDEVFTTQFCFGRVGIPDYEASEIETVDREDVVVYTRSREEPIHLIRPTCNLSVYERLDAGI